MDTKMNYNRRFGVLKLTPKCVNAEFPKTFQLSQEQLNFFAENGYLVMKNLIDFGLLNNYSSVNILNMDTKMNYNRRFGLLKLTPKCVNAEFPKTFQLSQEQLDFFEENGYLVIKNLIDFGSLNSYRKRFSEICDGSAPRGMVTIVKEPKLIKEAKTLEDCVNKMQDIIDDEVFATYVENPGLLDVVSQLIGDNISAVHTMVINKPPGTGRHPPHQDLYYFPFRPAEKIVTTWTAIDEVTIENGCLYVLPGSHRGDLHRHGYPEDLYYFPFRPSEKIVTTWTAIDEVTIENGCLYVLPGSHRGDLHRHGYPEKFEQLFHGIMDEDKVAPEHKRVDLVMGPGDTVFFQSGLVHGSRPNVSKVYRKIISCHYASGDCHYIDITGTVQQKIADEIVAAFKKRGVDLTYEEMWRHKCKQVKPTKSNL
ncbi:probable phytanoyl-CoA dioxygenase [Ostrinia furnacalis]|uniref:probable phytanoyl-CoA dioxygenase n=1 Tax=Ostrinia furnacalis TaxID=93504 RepID=UPI001038FD46|nr:probable phytanoyl-CoA dioxygenase [Ostrinia furnacalis]